ncbi:MAG: hypothetical protein MK142_10630, partial [Pseudomonadales bacterium]|nr:hypothetical protein [Pseudomonadales bacterium]
MASPIATLRALLTLETAAFERGEKRARASNSRLRNSMRDTAAGISKAGKRIALGLAGVATAAGAAGGASAGMLANLRNQANLAGLGVQEFKELSIAARSVGVEQGKLADVLKDVTDKVGDFLVTGGGPIADFFEQVASKVGVTADQFRNLNSRDALQLYVDSLERANVSQGEMVFFMEAIASDATALIPLFRDNGAAIAVFAQRARELGLSIDQDLVNSAANARAEFQVISEVMRTKFAVAMAEIVPALSQLADVVFPALQRLLNAVAGAAKLLAAVFRADVAGATEVVRSGFESLRKMVLKVGTAWRDLQELFRRGGALIGELMSFVGQKIEGTFRKAFGGVIDGFNNMIAAFGKATEGTIIDFGVPTEFGESGQTA